MGEVRFCEGTVSSLLTLLQKDPLRLLGIVVRGEDAQNACFLAATHDC